MTARDALTAMYVPTSDADETEWATRLSAFEAQVLRRAADLVDAGGPTCECDDCVVSRANAAALRHEADLTEGGGPR